MLTFRLNLCFVIVSLLNIGLLCGHIHCLDESFQENVEQETNDSQDITGILDIINKRDLLTQRLSDAAKLEMQNNPDFSDYKTSSNTPYTIPANRANLQNKTRYLKPGLKNSEKRKRISQDSVSKSKRISDKVNGKVMTLDCGCQELPSVQTLQQETKVGNENPSCLKYPENMPKIRGNFNYDVNESGQNWINKNGVDGLLNTITNNVDLKQESDKKNNFLSNILLPKELSELASKDQNEIENRNVIPRVLLHFTEILQEQNNILKELLSKIVHSDNVPGKAANEANSKMIHLILDVNNIGSRNFDLELNPLFKFRDEYGQSNSNVVLEDDKNWLKNDNKSKSEDDLSYFARNDYISYPYNDPIMDVSTQAPVLYENKLIKKPWNYGYCNSNLNKVIPHNTNDYLPTMDKTSDISTSFNTKATVYPKQSYYNRYMYSPISQLYNRYYNKYQNPLQTYSAL